jgi:signal transduction histidine kinase
MPLAVGPELHEAIRGAGWWTPPKPDCYNAFRPRWGRHNDVMDVTRERDCGMSIDPHVVRSESHGDIGSVLQRDTGILIERWCHRAVEEQPQAARVHQEVLRDSLPAFLAALGRSLEASDEQNGSQHKAPALEHGEQRWENGWSLPEVIRDYQILRLVIVEYLEDALERPVGGREVMAIGLALDEAIALSVGMYVTGREDHIRQVERERAEQQKLAEDTRLRWEQESLRRQAAALKEADSRKDEFLAILAHELRNSLAPLLHSVEVLRLFGTADPAVLQIKDVVERQVLQMIRLVDDLLDLSRISLGKVELRKQRHDLATVVAAAIETSGPLLDALHHKLAVHLPTEPLWLEVDQTRLVQVIANLLNNAAKYTDAGGQIVLTGEREGDEAVIRVRDTGVGIPPEMLDRVFDLFIQVPGSAGRSKGGLGVGLALVRRLVEMHGGKVTAHSGGIGQGSEFIVRLPAGTEARQIPSASGR